jgi:predicted phage terminase large subunit-like protein
VTPENELIWLHTERFRKEVPDIVPALEEVYWRYRPLYAAIEAVAANNAVYQYAKRTRMTVRAVSPLGKDKLVRATKAMVLAGAGRLWLPEWAPWLPDVESELVRFTGNDREDAHDDVVDALSYAAALLEDGEPDMDPAQSLMTFGRR